MCIRFPGYIKLMGEDNQVGKGRGGNWIQEGKVWGSTIPSSPPFRLCFLIRNELRIVLHEGRGRR